MPSYLSLASRTSMRMARRSSLSTTGEADRAISVRCISINGTSGSTPGVHRAKSRRGKYTLTGDRDPAETIRYTVSGDSPAVKLAPSCAKYLNL